MSEQKKKVQVRFQTTSSPGGTINHDLRKTKVSYLRDDMHHNTWHNIYSDTNDKRLKSNAEKSWKEYNLLFRERNKRNLTKGKQSDFLTGIITLSPIINEWLSNSIVTKNDLEKAFYDSVPLLQKKISNIVGDDSIQLHYTCIHYDEKTPHMHLAFSNHTSKGEAVWHTIRQSGRLSEFQDIVGDVFKNIGLERGEKKSGARHKSVREMHTVELKQLKKELQDFTKIIQEKKKNIKKLELTNTEKKQELDKLDTVLKQNRQIIKEVKSTSTITSQISKDIDNLLQDSTKFGILQKDKLSVNLKLLLQTYSKIDLKTLEEEKALKQVNILTNENNSLVEDYNSLVEDYNQIRNDNENLYEDNCLLKDKNNSLENVNQELKEDITNLEKDYKFNYRNWKENRKSNFTAMQEKRRKF